jgi:hypothetical protein
LFVVMSAVVPAPVVDQLARALAPHPVLIHHDFTQLREFSVSAPNASFVPDPKIMGWGVWGFSAGVFHALRHATQHFEFDYLQLLSSSCLPIKSMTAFQAHVAASDADAHVGSVSVRDDTDALMWVGWRIFTPCGTLRHRVLRRLGRLYFGPNSGRRDVAGIWMRSGPETNARGNKTLTASAVECVHRAFANPHIGRHIFDDDLPPWFGSTWFGARRHTIEGMLRLFEQAHIQQYFERVWFADEFIIPTLARKAGARCADSDFMIGTFDEARPKTFDDSDFDALKQTPAFFARKFPSDPLAPIRMRVVRELVGAEAYAGQSMPKEA